MGKKQNRKRRKQSKCSIFIHCPCRRCLECKFYLGICPCPELADRTYIWGGPPQKKKPPRIIFWRAGPLYYRLPPLGECSRNPSVSVYQLALLWEAVLGFSEIFLKALSMHLPISWWVTYKHTCPLRAQCSAVFCHKQHDPLAPPSLLKWQKQ